MLRISQISMTAQGSIQEHDVVYSQPDPSKVSVQASFHTSYQNSAVRVKPCSDPEVQCDLIPAKKSVVNRTMELNAS